MKTIAKLLVFNLFLIAPAAEAMGLLRGRMATLARTARMAPAMKPQLWTKSYNFKPTLGTKFTGYNNGNNGNRYRKFTYTKAAMPLLSAGAIAAGVAAIEQRKNKQNYKQHASLFSHGLGGNKNNARQYHKAGILTGGDVHSFDYPDVTPEGGFNAAEASLGQDMDIKTLQKAYQAVKDDEKAIALVGVSRGAATIVNFLASTDCPTVRAVVLESPFDHVASVVKNKVGVFSSVSHAAISMLYKKYDPNGPQPINSVAQVPRDVPMLIVCSRQDTLIPAESSQALYKALKKNGHEHVYLLTTEHGAHAQILWSADAELYRNTVHAFYKAHNMPHNATWAAQGHESLKKCQPTSAELEKQAQKSSWFSSRS